MKEPSEVTPDIGANPGPAWAPEVSTEHEKAQGQLQQLKKEMVTQGMSPRWIKILERWEGVGGGGQWLFQGLGRELSWRQPLASFLGSPCIEFSWQLRGSWATPTLHLATISVPFSGYSQVLEAWVRLTTGKPQRNGFEAASRQGGEGSSSSDLGANEEWGAAVGSQVRGGGTAGEELPLSWQCLLLNYIPLQGPLSQG